MFWKEISSLHILFLLIVITILLSYVVCILQNAFADITPFTREEVPDRIYDWDISPKSVKYYVDKTYDGRLIVYNNYLISRSNCDQRNLDFPSPDIASASYLSDGKVLDTSLWLTRPFKETSLNKSISSLPFVNDSNISQALLRVDIAYAKDRTLDKMFKDEIVLLARQKDFHLDNSKEFLTNQTYKIVYEFTGHNNNICKRCKAMEISIKKDDKVYTESYFSDIKKYPLLLEKAQLMVNLAKIGENASVRSSVNASNNFLKYENNTYKATILYPHDWKVNKTNTFSQNDKRRNVVAFYSPNASDNKFPSRIRLFVYDSVGEHLRLNDYLRKINDEYTKTLRNFKSLKITTNFRFPGYNATYSMVYNYTTRGNIPVKVNETGIMIGDDRVYTIRYIATKKQYDSSMQILQKMISSFKIDPIMLRYEDPSLGVKINYTHNWTLVSEFGPRDPLKRPHHNTVLDRTGSYSPGSNDNLIASIGFFSPIDGPYSVYKSYSMYVNYDSAYAGHRNVAPYAVAIEWNSQNRTWIKTIREWSLDGKQQRILYNDTKTYDKFFEKGKGYVHIDLNLNSLNIRKQFYLYFSVYDVFVNDGHVCSLVDSTPFVSVPPPTYSIYINSSSPKIMVGDNETIPLYLKTSSPDLPFVVSFKPNKTADTDLEFKPPTLSGGASPILTTSNMQINVTKNAKPGIHSIPIYASIILTPSIGTNNSRSAIIHLFSNLTLNVEPPLTSGEIVKRFYTDWITPISGIWTFLAGVAATITPMIIFMYRRNRS